MLALIDYRKLPSLWQSDGQSECERPWIGKLLQIDGKE